MFRFLPVSCEYLYLVRHGDVWKFDENAAPGHSSEWGLTPGGLEQAAASGKWILADAEGRVDRKLCGSFHRLRQHAKHMRMGGKWSIKNHLRPRSRGALDQHPKLRELTRHLVHNTENIRVDGGETVAELRDRSHRVLDTIYKNGIKTRRAVVVTARELIWGIQANLEGWTDEDLERLLDEEKRSESTDIRGGEIIQYACWDPMSWFRPRSRDGLTKKFCRGVLDLLSSFTSLLMPGRHYRSPSFTFRRRVSPLHPERTTAWERVMRRDYLEDELCDD